MTIRKRHPHTEPANSWLAFLCHRCGRFFRAQGVHLHCVRCISAAAAAGVIGSEFIGEASGS